MFAEPFFFQISMENMSTPLFPDLMPKLTDSLWFNVDKPVDDDTELTQLEHEHTNWVNIPTS